jgi:hypothetical protein
MVRMKKFGKECLEAHQLYGSTNSAWLGRDDLTTPPIARKRSADRRSEHRARIAKSA